MKKTNKIYVSGNQIVGIREFMREYMGVEYPFDHNLSHYLMNKYLYESGYKIPKRVDYSKVDEYSINSGHYIAVQEETKRMKQGKVLIYENPHELYIGMLLNELKKVDVDELRELRNKILTSEYGLYENSDDELVSFKNNKETANYNFEEEEEYSVNNSVNRQKQYVITGRRTVYMRGVM